MPTSFWLSTWFYVFRLPFYEKLQGSITVLRSGPSRSSAFVRCSECGKSKATGKITLRDGIAQHFIRALSSCLGCRKFRMGASFWIYQLVYSTLGVVHGAGYAAAHITRVALWVMTGASALACITLAFGYFRPRAKASGHRFVTYAVLYVRCGAGVAHSSFNSFVGKSP